MSEANKSEPLKQLEAIFEKQRQDYLARKERFDSMWEQAVEVDLPRVKAFDAKLFKIKWISILAIIGFFVYKVIL